MIVVVVFRRKASIKGNHTERENVIDKELSLIVRVREVAHCNKKSVGNGIIQILPGTFYLQSNGNVLNSNVKDNKYFIQDFYTPGHRTSGSLST